MSLVLTHWQLLEYHGRNRYSERKQGIIVNKGKNLQSKKHVNSGKNTKFDGNRNLLQKIPCEYSE